jgi:dTDP-4-amino-4,6-dideoxygalactose transaminase
VDQAIAHRKAVDAAYRALLAGVPGIAVLDDAGERVANHSYFPILVGDAYALSRDALYARLKEAGVHARRYFHPLISDFPMYRGLPSAARANLPVAADASARVLCLPIYPDLAHDDVARIAGLIREA